MNLYKRFAILLFICVFVITLSILRPGNKFTTWRNVPHAAGLGESTSNADKDGYPPNPSILENGNSPENIQNAQQEEESKGSSAVPNKAIFKPGHAKSAGSTYTKAVVLGRLSEESVDWIDKASFPPGLQTYVYVVDGDRASSNEPLRTPENKGHEAMVYLSYIIDHYDSLSDINIFLHAHQLAWHSNEMLNHNAVEIINRLSPEKVTRDGYMNLRCHGKPGCPAWIRPLYPYPDPEKPEEAAMARAWTELFPSEPVPRVIGSPCCAQFAISRDRIRSLPLAKYIYLRDWLLKTNLPDETSGRVFEYLWGYIFTGQTQSCPDQRVCYCDGFGVCFEDSGDFEYWFKLKYQWDQLHKELDAWRKTVDELARVRAQGGADEDKLLVIPKVDGDLRMLEKIDVLYEELDRRRIIAMNAGKDPRVRAKVAGRKWEEGDGF